MAETVAQLVADVKLEGGFDVEDATALRWLDRRHKRMCARARCYRKSVDVGDTVADTRDYAVPEGLVELLEVTVGGYPYGRARHIDLANGALGYLLLDGVGGVVAATHNASAAKFIALYPTPTESGAEILAYGVFSPPTLELDNNPGLVIDEDFADELVAGAIATGLAREDQRPDLARAFEETFDAGCEEFRRRVSRRFRGAGPAEIRVQGFNA